jgi:hypothetical protein
MSEVHTPLAQAAQKRFFDLGRKCLTPCALNSLFLNAHKELFLGVCPVIRLHVQGKMASWQPPSAC